MGMITTTYSNAAPYIRRALIYYAHTATTAELKREQARAIGQVSGLTDALRIMRNSKDQPDFLPGVIAEAHTLPPSGFRRARELLGEQHWRELGFEEPS